MKSRYESTNIVSHKLKYYCCIFEMLSAANMFSVL